MEMSDFLALFLEEAEEQLLKLDDGFLQLEKDPSDIETLKEVFRAAHTLKGSSATMGLTEIANLTHAMENLLDQLRSETLVATPEVIDLLLAGTDFLRTLIGQVSRGEAMNVDTEELLEGLKAVCAGASGEQATGNREQGTGPSTSLRTGREQTDGIALRLKIADNCLMPSVRAFMIYNALSGLGDIVSSDPPEEQIDDVQAGQDINIVFEPNQDSSAIIAAMKSLSEIELINFTLPDSDESLRKPQAAEVGSTPKGVAKKPSAGSNTEGGAEPAAKAIQTVRVGVDRLDTLMNLVAELVIDRTRMNQISSDLGLKYENEELIQGLNETGVHIGRVVTELQEHIMKVRLLPVEQVFSRFPRMVRDLAHKAGKDIEFVMEGQETELDRSILEEIVDPITHLLRNAVDHGTETPETRKAAGKPARARVLLAAKQEENRIIIEVRDEGRGISIEKVKAAALKQGAIGEETLSRMSDEEALQLIFASGVSTAEKVTDVSGRGVGMDVVRSNIQGLSGTVEVHSEPGKGTTFRINLPLTLAIIQSLVTGVNDMVYVIPLSAVAETFRCRADEMHYIDGNPAINFRGSVLHLVRLASLFGHGEEMRSADSSEADDWVTFVVVRTGGLKVGLVVDRLIGEQEVVIKPLGAFFGDIDGIAGATILGDGRVALIVDVGSLGKLVNRRRLDRVAA
ncbi:MAG: chemotaxis protein CheA [Armatimonadetes bacterium]|nr:chemotaxis protein CheA [Armatimonadota bacterium]